MRRMRKLAEAEDEEFDKLDYAGTICKITSKSASGKTRRCRIHEFPAAVAGELR